MTADELLIEPIAGVDLDSIFKTINDFAPCAITAVFRGVDYPAFLKSSYWRAVSHAVKERDGRRCKVCNQSRGLEAHHRRYDMPRGTEHIHLIDLTTLCGDCHGLYHASKNKTVKPKKKTGKLSKKERLKQAKFNARTLDHPKPLPASCGGVPSSDLITLTRPLIKACMRNGAFTSATTNALGITDFKKGWTKRLAGIVVTKDQYQNAVDGRMIKRIGFSPITNGGNPNANPIEQNSNFKKINGRLIYSPPC